MNQPTVNGKKLQELREAHYLTQREVGWLFGLYTGHVIDYTTVSAHESGRRGVGGPEAKTYAQIYKVQTTELYDVTPNSQPVTE